MEGYIEDSSSRNDKISSSILAGGEGISSLYFAIQKIWFGWHFTKYN